MEIVKLRPVWPQLFYVDGERRKSFPKDAICGKIDVLVRRGERDTMELTETGALQIAKRVDAILHVPGNYRGGNLEMTIVIDTSLESKDYTAAVAAVVRALKRGNEIFRNVRLNLVFWGQEIKSEVAPMAMLMTGGAFREYQNAPCKKYYEDLFAYLKKFHARSKVILVFADGQNEVYDTQAARAALSPFLKSKLLLISEQVVSGTEFLLRCM